MRVSQKAASEGMLLVMYFLGLCFVPFFPGGERRLSSVCLPLCLESCVGWSDAEGLFTVAPWGERDVKSEAAVLLEGLRRDRA